MGLEKPTFKGLLHHHFFQCCCWGAFSHCHLHVSSPSVQLGRNSTSSVFPQAFLRSRCYIQLWAVPTWLSLEMAHSPHLTAGSHHPVPPLWRCAPTDRLPGWHKKIPAPDRLYGTYRIGDIQHRMAFFFSFLSAEVSLLPCLKTVHLALPQKPALWSGELCVTFHRCPVEASRLGSLKRKTSICSKGILPNLITSNQTSLAERALPFVL